jgi:hypothetical protein
MPLSEDDRAYVVETACDLLRHAQRERAISVIEQRVATGDGYADERELALDKIVLAVARTIDAELAEPA